MLVHDLLRRDVPLCWPRPRRMRSSKRYRRWRAIEVRCGGHRLAEHALGERQDVPLAVGAAGMDECQPPLPVAQMLHQGCVRAWPTGLLTPPLDGVYVCRCRMAQLVEASLPYTSGMEKPPFSATLHCRQLAVRKANAGRLGGRDGAPISAPSRPCRPGRLYFTAARPLYALGVWAFPAPETPVMARLPGGIFVHTFPVESTSGERKRAAWHERENGAARSARARRCRCWIRH